MLTLISCALSMIQKWKTFDNKDELITLSKLHAHLNISDIKVKDPDNPAKLKPAKMITFYI